MGAKNPEGDHAPFLFWNVFGKKKEKTNKKLEKETPGGENVLSLKTKRKKFFGVLEGPQKKSFVIIFCLMGGFSNVMVAERIFEAPPAKFFFLYGR